VFVAAAVALGLVVGSFLNVVIHRAPRGESIVRPRSRCPRCGRALTPLENVPVLSWLALRGRCRGCRAPISPRYPLVELATGALFALCALRFGPGPEAVLWMVFAAGLLAAAVIDQEHHIIPDSLSLGGLALGLVAGAVTGRPGTALAGALMGGGSLWLVGFLHARVSTAMGRRFEHWPDPGEPPPGPASADYWLWFPGLGLGDVKLMAAIGAFVGPARALETLLAASLLGLAMGGMAALARGRISTPFGFGPALAAGALAVTLVPHRPLAALLLP
jgi:leader peptidase (prepilin peptidase)/N-methyltransferase